MLSKRHSPSDIKSDGSGMIANIFTIIIIANEIRPKCLAGFRVNSPRRFQKSRESDGQYAPRKCCHHSGRKLVKGHLPLGKITVRSRVQRFIKNSNQTVEPYEILSDEIILTCFTVRSFILGSRRRLLKITLKLNLKP